MGYTHCWTCTRMSSMLGSVGKDSQTGPSGLEVSDTTDILCYMVKLQPLSFFVTGEWTPSQHRYSIGYVCIEYL